MNIGLTYNLFIDKTLSDEEPPPCSGEYDSPKTILAIENALKSLGHAVILIEADENAYMNLYKMRDKIDFVFNIAEGLSGECREAQIPMMLEMLDISYAGSGPLAMAITLDKARTKEILIANGIPTPLFQIFDSADEELKSDLNFPVILKPNGEGSSIGIEADSVCKDEKSFRKKLQQLFEKYNQPVIVEKFLSGREFTVSLIGNGDEIETLPIVEIDYGSFPKMEYYLDCHEAKNIWCERDGLQEVVIAEDKLAPGLKKNITKLAIDTFKILEIRDFARVDIRADDKGKLYVLEVNPLPGINPSKEHFSYFRMSADAAGLSYKQMLSKILNAAFTRLNKAGSLPQGKRSLKIIKNEFPLAIREKT